MVSQQVQIVRIEAIAVRLVIFLVSGVIHLNSIWCQGVVDEDAIHGVGLGLGTQGITVLLMMEIAEGEERKPSSLIQSYAMNKHKGWCQLTMVFWWYHVHHSNRVFYSIVPQATRHLLLSEVCSQHMHNDFLVWFDEAVGWSLSRRTCNDGRELFSWRNSWAGHARDPASSWKEMTTALLTFVALFSALSKHQLRVS